MNNSKSQTATEYLILLAVVIVVALVVVNALGVFPGIGSSTSKKTSDFKLSGDVVGVTSYFIGTNSSIFNLKNNNYDTIIVTEFRINQQTNLTCNSSNTIPVLPAVLNIGQSVTINCSAVNSSNYVLSDRKTLLIGISYIDSLGATRLAGNVLTYDAVVSLSEESGSSNESGESNTSNSTISGPINGLVAYYPFDGNMSDMSGNGFNGNCTGTTCPTLNASGVIGSVYKFDGSNDYINLSNSSVFYTNNQFTASLWFKLSGSSGTYRGLLSSRREGPNTNFGINFLNNNKVEFSIGNVGVISSNVAYTDLNWHNVIVSYDRDGTSYMYVDGILQTQTSTSDITWSTSYYYVVGKFYDLSNNYYFNGSIDEVRIYNRSLNLSEVLELYNLGSINASRVLSMNFNSREELPYPNNFACNSSTGCTGTYVRDGSLYNNNGSLNGYVNDTAWRNVGSFLNNSLQFPGSRGYSSYISYPKLLVGPNTTISAWMRWTDSLSQYNAGSMWSDGGNYFIDLDGSSFGPDGGHLLNYRMPGSLQQISGYPLNSTWGYFAIVRNDTNVSFYKNNVLIAVRPAVRNATNISRFGFDGYYNFGGSLDEFMFFNRTLNSTEMQAIYNNQSVGQRYSGLENDASLLAYYTFDELSGNTSLDIKGGSNATLSSYPVATTPIYNATGGPDGSGAYVFDGVNDYILTNQLVGSYTNNAKEVTISAWINPKNISSVSTFLSIFNTYINAGNGGFSLAINGSFLRMGGRSVTTDSFQGTYANFNSYNQWSNVVGINDYQNSRQYIYLNGILVANSSVSFANRYYTYGTPTSTEAIGMTTSSPNSNFNGSIDNVQIFNRALNASEVMALYSQ